MKIAYYVLMKDKNKSLVQAEVIENKIFIIRGQKVMIDKDLAKLYEVDTRNLNKALLCRGHDTNYKE